MEFRGTRCLSILLFLLPLLLIAGSAEAAQTLQIAVEPGVTEIEVGDHTVRIETDANVIVSLTVDGDTITGTVSPASGTRSATVTITVLGPPDRVIFDRRFSREQIFRDYIPRQETGQGEM